MISFLAIAIAAGFASALLATASQTGPGLGVFLGFLSPLPLMIAAIGWHPLLALFGGALTAAFITEFFGWNAGLTFALVIMVPTYLLARIIQEVEDSKRVGTVVMASAFYAVLIIIVFALTLSSDFEGYQAIIRKRLEFVLQSPNMQQFVAQLPPTGSPEAQKLVELMTEIMPILSAASFSLMYFLNIWLACRIAQRSGMLTFAWTPVWNMTLPRVLLPVVIATMLMAALPGYLGFAAELISNAATLAITALGYACIHHITRGSSKRGFILSALWVSTFALAGLPALLMLLVGIAELAFGWRGRILPSRNS
ncbi:MAG: DUF2232 domain-containing protein [Beijerinckiaceae bacterium]